tara:strand:+ start:52 stop:1017 length:966 start_codon:yes stop_codon:yes gene_type:complete
LPVGNSDKGVGLWGGQIMFSLDNNNQYIDWWHEPVPGSGEDFDHEGTLTTTLLSPSVTIGLSNYWNINITQLLGTRTMTWEGDSPTKHHRDENSLSDFINATGGVLGDTRLLIRYLAYNDGQGEGKRLFLGGGMVFPSKNTITSDPFFLNGEHETDHRHFSISEGVQKGVFELQYYKKRNTNPVFIGGSITAELPTGKNKYGYQGSQMFETSLVVLSQMIKKIKTSIGGNFSVRHTTQAYWNNKKAPNSRATIISPGVSFLWNIKKGSFALGIQKPTFVSGGMSGTEAENLKQKINAWQISLSYRRVLDFVIPWIDPLGDL